MNTQLMPRSRARRGLGAAGPTIALQPNQPVAGPVQGVDGQVLTITMPAGAVLRAGSSWGTGAAWGTGSPGDSSLAIGLNGKSGAVTINWQYPMNVGSGLDLGTVPVPQTTIVNIVAAAGGAKATAPPGGGTSSNTGLIVAGVAAGGALLVGGYFLLRKRKGRR